MASSRDERPDEMTRYLTDVYRRDILGESREVVMPGPDPKLIRDAEAEIARIDGLRLGANLASRDFVSYQNRRALVALLAQLRAAQKQQEPVPSPTTKIVLEE